MFSIFSNDTFASMPALNPVSLFPEPMTRWHGIMIPMGLRPTACPTALADVRLLGYWWFRLSAILPYVVVVP